MLTSNGMSTAFSAETQADRLTNAPSGPPRSGAPTLQQLVGDPASRFSHG